MATCETRNQVLRGDDTQESGSDREKPRDRTKSLGRRDKQPDSQDTPTSEQGKSSTVTSTSTSTRETQETSMPVGSANNSRRGTVTYEMDGGGSRRNTMSDRYDMDYSRRNTMSESVSAGTSRRPTVIARDIEGGMGFNTSRRATGVSRDFDVLNPSHNNSRRPTIRSSMSSRRQTMTRSSISSTDSETNTAAIAMSKRWTTLETVGRCMFLCSVAFFIVGVLITVFGFSNTGIERSQQVPLQILGPTCLGMTVVMWVVGCIFSRLWNLEWKRQQRAFELRDRVQLHALAMDILNYPVLSPGMLQDPKMRRQLLLKLRAQKTLDYGSESGPSRRSSKATTVGSRRRYSSVQYERLMQREIERKMSKDGGQRKPPFELPGIQISRIETLDFGDSRASIGSIGSNKSRQYIIIHSDVGSDFSRLSCPSDYSIAGSSRSRSRSSRASSNVSSRLWDFSPRESEWDADISLGSRESQLSVAKQDWGGGPGCECCRDDEYSSPVHTRKYSVVTFDMGSPSLRRHSSPGCATRRKESGCSECACGKQGELTSAMKAKDVSCHSLRFNDNARMLDPIRKKSADFASSCRSLKIDEDDRENDVEEEIVERKSRPPLRRNNTDDSEVERRVARLFREIEYSVTDSIDESKINSFSTEFDYFPRKVEVKEAESQTLTESELLMLNSEPGGVVTQEPRTACMTFIPIDDSPSQSLDMPDPEGAEEAATSPKPNKEKKSRTIEKKLSAISSALASFGRRSNSTDRDKRPRTPFRTLTLDESNMHETSFSFDKEGRGVIKSPPPKYEDIMNKNV